MDDARFDHLARMLANANPSRRQTLKLLGGGGLAAGLGRLLGFGAVAQGIEAAGKNRKRNRRKKRQQRPLCQAKAFRRCTKPAAEAFAAAVEDCRPDCAGDPESAACQSCLTPVVEAAAAAGAACGEEVCRGGHGEANPEAEVASARAAATAKTCDSAELTKCTGRKDGDLFVCLGTAATPACLAGGPAACATAVVACYGPYLKAIKECREDFGCKGGGYCIDNTCCPGPLDSVCGSVCCRLSRCEECVGGVCKGCKKPASCGSTPSGDRECQCPSVAYVRCGKTCCNTKNCEECVDGRCRSKCTKPKVCRGELFPTCMCPKGRKPCGDTCCRKGQQCCNGTCRNSCEFICPGGYHRCGTTCCHDLCEVCDGGTCRNKCGQNCCLRHTGECLGSPCGG